MRPPGAGQKTAFSSTSATIRLHFGTLTRKIAASRVLISFALRRWGLRARMRGQTRLPLSTRAARRCTSSRRGWPRIGCCREASLHAAALFESWAGVDPLDVRGGGSAGLRQVPEKTSPGDQGYQKLNRLAWAGLPAGGILFTCSCSTTFRKRFAQAVGRGRSQESRLYAPHLPWKAGPDTPVLLSMPETLILNAWGSRNDAS